MDSPPDIIEISFEDLIAKLTSAEYSTCPFFLLCILCVIHLLLIANDLLYDVLFTYRTFTTPEDLLNAVLTRFWTVPVKGATLEHVQLKVISVLRTWVERYWFDFSKGISFLHFFAKQIFVFPLLVCRLWKFVDNSKRVPNCDCSFRL